MNSYPWVVYVKVLAGQGGMTALRDGVIWVANSDLAGRVAAAESVRTGTPHAAYLVGPPYPEDLQPLKDVPDIAIRRSGTDDVHYTERVVRSDLGLG